MMAKVDHYQAAVRRWHEAGCPIRTDEEMAEIFEQHCAKCPYYANGTCRHEQCGCNVGPPDEKSPLVSIASVLGVGKPAEALTNKLRMATEKCPTGKFPAAYPRDVKQLAAVSCLFGMPSERQIANAREFAHGLRRQGVSLTFAAQDATWLPDECDDAIVVDGDRSLWQKERLLNLAISRLPDSVDAVAWVDADVLFRDDLWAKKTLEALHRHHVVQPWSKAVYQTQPGDGWPKEYVGITSNPRTGHPGLAWAARRDFLVRVGGLFEHAILGGGDLLMADAWLDRARSRLPDLRTLAKKWSGKVSVGRVDGTIEHLWHGTRPARKYNERDEVMVRSRFDPIRHVQYSPAGLWEWTEEAPAELVAYARKYFEGRLQDVRANGDMRDDHGA